MGIFDKIGAATPPANSNYLQEGKLLLKIESTKIKNDRNDLPMFVAEFTVIKVLDKAGTAHRQGETVSHVVKKSSEYFLGEVKGLIAAACNAPLDKITPEMAEECVGDEQPLAGMVLQYEGVKIETKKSTPEDRRYVTRRMYKWSVSFTELYEELTEEERDRFFPGMDWEVTLAAEAE